MKVLYIAPDVPVPHAGKFLGGSTHVLKVAESLAAKGCEVFIISRRMPGQAKFEKMPKFISAADVCVVPYKLKDGKFKKEIK